MQELTYAQRPPIDEADGLLILHHGRGGNEHELLGLGDVLDRVRRLHVITPRAPLALRGRDSYQWFGVGRIGYPDRDTFLSGYRQLCDLHDEIWRRTGIPPSRTVLGGFSMGCAMTYATGLGPDRPRPAGILAFSGPIPTVEGWAPELETRVGMPVLIAHGRADESVDVEFARTARRLLTDGGLDVTYHETGGAHIIDPTAMGRAIQWLGRVL